MKKILLSVVAFMAGFVQTQAQVPNLVFSDIYAGTAGNSDFATAVLDYTNGEVIMAGATGNLNPSPFAVKAPYLNTNFVGRFNEVGANVWQSTIGAATVNQLAKDASNNIFAVGWAQGTGTSFDGTIYGNTGNNNLGSQNIFVAKYSPAGAILWVKVVGSSGDEFGTGITVDPAGDVYVTGHATSGSGIVDFEPGVAAATFTAGYKSFLVKLSNNGNYLWHKITPNGGYNAHAVCADANNVYWATQVSGVQNVNPTGPTWNAYSAGGYDILLLKYQKNGTLMSVKTVGGTSNTDYARSIKVKNGTIVMTGVLAQGSTAQINMNGYAEVPAVNLATTSLAKDGFVAVYDTLMNCQWAKPLGGSTVNDETFGAAFDNAGHVVVAGQFQGPVNFNIGGAGTYTANSNGANPDYFYSSYNIAGGECNWIYKQGGTAADKAVDIAVDVDGRIWAAGYINNGSTGNDMFLNKHFCASVYTVSVDRNGYTTPMTTSSFGNAFNFIGCAGQSAVYTATASTNTNIKYSFFDINGTQSNGSVFTETLTASGYTNKGYKLLVKDSVTKCEQVFNVQYAQINNMSWFALTYPFGSGAICPGDSKLLQGNSGAGYTYTWNPGNVVVPSPNTTIYVSPTVTTTYTATVYDNTAGGAGCYWSATATVTVDVCTGIADNTNDGSLAIYPNPANDVLYIESKQFSENVTAELMDITGKVVMTEALRALTTQIDLSHLPKGIYLVKVRDHEKLSVRKIIKE